MAGIGDKTLASTFGDLLQMDNSNSGVTTTLKSIKDGAGTESCLKISDDQLAIQPINDDTSAFIRIRTQASGDLLLIDSSNSLVKAVGNIVNTQYATFSIGYTESTNFIVNTHHAIPFASANYGVVSSRHIPAFGTATDPATTFTTAASNGTRASDLVPCMWYVPDNISIDGVTSIEGADVATGDTTRMHLFAYSFTSAATACLTTGTVIAHNTDVTNAGAEQPYLSTWTVDTAAVAGGKVILAMFRSDSINSDYSLSIKIKYHLT